MYNTHNSNLTKYDPTKLSKAALDAFFNIGKLWGLTTDEEIILLGRPARSTFFKWKKERDGHLSKDTLERISYLLGIYKALHLLLSDEQSADSWPRKPNQAPLFNGQTALSKMLNGRVIDLADVRRYLDAERGGW
jgi:hypothetical protein